MEHGFVALRLPDLTSRYASRYAPVTPGRYRGFDEQESTTDEGSEGEISAACDLQAGSHRLPCVRLRGTAVPGVGLAGSDCCGRDLDKAVLRSIEQIVALPDAIGDHACECGHPEMRRLPDGVFHCPACGSEVLPLDASREPTPEHRSQANWCGWVDGRFAESEFFTENPDLVRYSAPADKLDYLPGHRAGSEEARLAASNGRLPAGAVRGPENRSENNACKGDEKKR